MRQVGTGPAGGRRATPSPPPRTALRDPAAPCLPRPGSLRLGRRLPYPLLVMLVTVALGAVGLFTLAPSGRSTLFAGLILSEFEGLAELAGFGLEQVEVTGHRFTPDGDVFDALDLGNTRTLLSFDSRAAQIRIESLPWVDRASIERIVPDRLAIRVVERTPFAVWLRADRSYLIDRAGRVLAAVPPDEMPFLPRVAGEGAANVAAMLQAKLSAHPELARRVRVARRVGERRWTLQLTNDRVIHLPAEGETAALGLADVLIGDGLSKSSEIDLRMANRTVVRERSGSESAAGADLAASGI